MEKLIFRKIYDKVETELFLDKIQNYTSVRLPLAYVRNSEIVGVFLQNKLVAGYMLVTKPIFRSLLFVPDDIKQTNPFFSKDQYEMMEVNGLWIGPAVKTPRLQFQIWIKILKDVFFSRKKYLLLMSDVRNKTIERIHNLTSPATLYEGTPCVMVGDKTHDSVRISYTTRWRAVFNLPMYWMELKQREQRANTTLKQRTLART